MRVCLCACVPVCVGAWRDQWAVGEAGGIRVCDRGRREQVAEALMARPVVQSSCNVYNNVIW